RRDRLLIRLWRRKIPRPERLASVDRGIGLMHQKSVDPRHHLCGKIALLGERSGAGKRIGEEGGGEDQEDQKKSFEMCHGKWTKGKMSVLFFIPILGCGATIRTLSNIK